MIGVCTQCGCTDGNLIGKVVAGGFVVVVCEWCAEEDRREHDDVDYDSDSLGNEIRDASDDGDDSGRGP